MGAIQDTIRCLLGGYLRASQRFPLDHVGQVPVTLLRAYCVEFEGLSRPVKLYRTMSPVQVKIGTMPVFDLLRRTLLCHREQRERDHLADMLNHAARRTES